MKTKKDIISDERRTGDLTGMQSVLFPLAKKMLGKKAFIEADVICSWNEIVGDRIAELSKPIKIDFAREGRNNGVLWIEVASGAVALEMHSKTNILLEKINTFFGYAAVHQIKFIQNYDLFEEKKMKRDIHNLEKKLVTREEQTYITKVSGEIKTPKLSQAVERLGHVVITNNKK